MVRPPRLERGTPGLEEQWRMSEAALSSGGYGATHANYPRAWNSWLDRQWPAPVPNGDERRRTPSS